MEINVSKATQEMIGTSTAIREISGMIRKISAVEVPVLILGESGTGKELAARSIYRMSSRRDGPFVVINCGAIPATLLEAELFGYEKGAFTGADKERKGRLESANGGVLFLDEVGELSTALQVKLLRFLQERTIERLGGRKPVYVDARIISATNRDIFSMISKGSFRDDLYFRLGVITLEIPALRDRDEDIYSISLFFIKKYSKEFGRKITGVELSAMKAMRSYQWPGNIRELENKIKRAVALCQNSRISAKELDLPYEDEKITNKTICLAEAVESFKKSLIQETFLKNKGVISTTATELGISRQYLSKLMARHKLKL